MIKSKKEIENRRIEIDLTGPEGNAFSLLGKAKRFADQLELDWETVQKEMTESGYDHLVDTFDKYFGSFVTLYR